MGYTISLLQLSLCISSLGTKIAREHLECHFGIFRMPSVGIRPIFAFDLRLQAPSRFSVWRSRWDWQLGRIDLKGHVGCVPLIPQSVSYLALQIAALPDSACQSKTDFRRQPALCYTNNLDIFYSLSDTTHYPPSSGQR